MEEVDETEEILSLEVGETEGDLVLTVGLGEDLTGLEPLPSLTVIYGDRSATTLTHLDGKLT